MQGMCAQLLAVLAICAAWAGGGIDTTDCVACTWFGAHFIMGIMFLVGNADWVITLIPNAMLETRLLYYLIYLGAAAFMVGQAHGPMMAFTTFFTSLASTCATVGLYAVNPFPPVMAGIDEWLFQRASSCRVRS